MTNFYEVLGLSQDADEGEIKKAFRKLSLQHHPDRNPDEDTTGKFQEINEAFETLSNPEKRNQHDMELKFGEGVGHPFGGMDNDMGDINNIFNMMFGGGGGGGFPGMPGGGGIPGMPGIRIFHSGGGGPGMHAQFFHSFNRPEPIQKNVEITLEQSYHGCTISVEIERWIIINNNRSTEKDVLSITIPRGIDDDETIVIRDIGNNINNQVRGEVRLTIKIKNTTDFIRKGLDLYLMKKISLKDSLCGFMFEFEHFNGKKICMNNISGNNIIKPSTKKIINGLGFVKDSGSGNLIIEFEVEFPDTLNENQRELLKNIL
jgi:DnaJ-class molecular chaperone